MGSATSCRQLKLPHPPLTITIPPTHMRSINRTQLEQLSAREKARFVADHPKSEALFARASKSLLGGDP